MKTFRKIFGKNGNKKLKVLVSVLAAIIVFTTTYSLILPAITIDNEIAQEEPGIEIMAEETEAAEEVTEAAIEEAVAEVVEAVEEAEPVIEEPVIEEPAVEEEPAAEEPSIIEETAEAATDEAADQAESESASETAAESQASSETTTAKAEETTTAAVKMPKVTFTEETNKNFADKNLPNIIVKVEAEEGTFPEGTTMKVKYVTDDNTVEAAVKDAVNKDSRVEGEVKTIHTVDIAFFNKEGKEIEPLKEIKVTFKSDTIKDIDKPVLVHIPDEGKGEAKVVDQLSAQEENEIIFKADDFSKYVITETITTEYLSHSGAKYEVTVTYGPDAKIPEGSTLSVTDIDEGTDEYEYARNAVLADKKEKGETLNIDTFSLAALDISIIDPNGQEIEPEATVQVDIKIKDLPGVDDLSSVKDELEIQHHVEVGDGVVIEKVFDGKTEGSYEMKTNEEIAAQGIAVDPSSVSEEDFKIEEANADEIDASFEVEDFSTYTISWGGYYGSSTTVHYGYMNGNTFVEFTEQPSPVNVTTNYRTYLLYDFDGYTYSGYTYYRTTASNTPATGGTRIQAQLRYSSNNWRYHNYSTSSSNNNWNTIANNSHIYVTYNPETTPETGGTPEIDDVSPEDWPQDPSTPQFTKSSTNNKNGTNTVSLSISGGEKEIENSTKANVIVVLDVSGSMDENLGRQTRLTVAKNALYDMADTLLNDMSGVKMSLVTFSTTSSAIPVQEFTDDYNTFYYAVRGLTANGGTNWEQALFNANRLEVDDDAATFVVFVTDGDPTYRISRYNAPDSELYGYDRDGNYFAYNVFGAGNSDPNDRAFDAAAEEVSSILANNKSFYAIGVSSDVTKVQDLVDEAGGGNAFLATDDTALEEAFANITKSIKTTLGFGDVEITDGITELSNVEMKMMHEVDPDSFTYYKVTPSGQTPWDPASEGAGLASYDEETGAVKWELGEGFQLEDGVTYMVTFRVWPSQDAYDLIADLNNGVKVYAAGQPNSITDEERGQIQELAAPTATEQGRYTLKTNTDTVNATYSQTSSTGETVTVSGETDLVATYHEGTIDDMVLLSELLTIQKVFDQSLDPRTVESVTLKLQRKINDSDHEMADYNVPGTTSPNIVLGDFNDWKYSFYVAPGFIVDGKTLETGYQFTVVEPDLGENTVRYDLIPEIINPMVVDGTLQLVGDGDNNQALTAINRTRSAIEIHKTLYDIDGTTQIYPDTEFTITGQLLGPDGTPFTSQEVAAPVAYYLYDKEGNATTGRLHFEDSSNISFTLKAGEFIRFVNVPEGCTFEFSETAIPDNYVLQSLAAVGRQRAENDPAYTYSIELDDTVAHLVEGETTISTTDEGIIGNTNYKLDFYNRRVIPLPDVELVKVDQDDSTKKLNGASFELHKDSVDGAVVTTDGNGNAIDITTGNKEGSTGPDGWYHIGLLPAGTYYLVETAEPDNYVPDETPIIITVTKGSNSYTVTATKDGESVLSGPTDGLYTITVDNEINLTEAEAHKAWKNADGSTTAPSGASVVYTLYADGEATDYTVTLDGANDVVPEGTAGYESVGWTATFVNLPKYKFDNGEKTEIVYTIKETTTYPGYTASPTAPVANGETITNTQEATTANALKAWENADGSTNAPDGATVVYTLYADGTATSYTVTLDGTVNDAPAGTAGYESAAWKAEFINLPKYQTGTTTEIVYTIAETTTYPGYTASPTAPVASGETITNKQGSTETYAEKAWKNADGSTDAPEGATVVFTLYADGVATNYKVTLDGTVDTAPTVRGGYESEAWKATFVKLAKSKIVDGEAVDIVYTIAETTTYPGYTPSTTEPVGSGSKITNSQDPTSANALKAWVNADDTTEAPQGGQVIYTLYADGEATEYTVTLDGTVDSAPEVTGGYESEAWKAEFVNLPKYKIVNGAAVEIEYKIAETTTYPGYTASTTDPVESGETITNTQEKTDANAIKAWKNADGTATPPTGATVEFTLYADGEATEYKVTLDGTPEETVPTAIAGYESEAWKATFVNLPKYKVVEGEAEGETEAVEIVYTIGESLGYAGYTATSEEPVASGGTITNTQDDIDVYATKAWLNADGTDTAPEGATVVFTLLADGEATEHTVILDGAVDEEVPEATGGYESEAWKAEFINLPKYQADGTTEIVYTIAETQGFTGYKASTTEPVESGKSITNSQLSAEIKIKKIGDGDVSKVLDVAQFELYSTWEGADSTENVKAKNVNGADVGTITTSSGLATIGKLLPGTYYLVETAAPDGYNMLTDPVEIYIQLVEQEPGYTVSYMQKDYTPSSAVGNLSPQEDGAYLITVSDPSGNELPHTGGTGTLPYTLGGIALIVASALMYGFRMRRRERRLKE